MRVQRATEGALIRASIKKSRRWDIEISMVKVRSLYSEWGYSGQLRGSSRGCQRR